VPAILGPGDLRPFLDRLAAANAAVAARYPGDPGRRQPVHTVYGGAQIFKRDTAGRLGRLALAALDAHGPDAGTFAAAAGVPPALAAPVYERVREKLRREPVEDFRIDFEDGYGNRPDAEEDADAERTAAEVAAGLAAGTLPPFLGIRVKPLSEELKARAARTLDLFLSALVAAAEGASPPEFFERFVVTLPKITSPEQPAALAALLARLEERLELPPGSLRFEVMIETPQSVFAAGGEAAAPALVAAGGGRCVAAHFGTYDYTALMGITAAHQHMTHPACDFARHVLQVSLAGTGVWLSDGATNVLPVAPHRAAPDGPPLTAEQEEENRRSVHAAWRLHADHVRHSLTRAYYQGWDLHPAQLPTRYAAVYAFFLDGLDAAAERLRHFIAKAAQATLIGDVFDDAATGQGLLNYFLRAVNCGAITEDEAVEHAGLTLAEIRKRSFLAILAARRG
jgi:citrate lyase beta subunit